MRHVLVDNKRSSYGAHTVLFWEIFSGTLMLNLWSLKFRDEGFSIFRLRIV